MSSDPKRPAGPAWRKNVSAPQNPKADGKRDWQKEKTPAAERKRWSRATKLKLALLAFLTCAALIVVLILYLQAPTLPRVAIVTPAESLDNLGTPSDAYGRRGAALIHEWVEKQGGGRIWWGTNVPVLVHPLGPVELKDANTPWDKDLDKVEHKGVLFVFLALHGGADAQGAYLLKGGDPGSDSSRLRVKDVLERLSSGKLKDKPTVLVLDATQVRANAFSAQGLLHNDFARQLKREFDPAKHTNLVVLCASDDDQASWVSEEWQTTVYAHWLLEGLRGGAAPKGGTITAWDLHQFVKDKVGDWVQANRGARQTPLLLPAGNDGKERAEKMVLALAPNEYKPRDPEQAPGARFHESAKLKELKEAWEKQERLGGRATPPWVYGPPLWRQYQDTLLRYEFLVRAGDDDGAKRAREELLRLEGKINASRGLELKSVPSALPAPAALGLDAAAPADEFQDLWRADKAARQGLWQALKKGGVQEQLLRARLARFLVDQVIRNPERLDDAVKLMALRDDDGSERPAEANFLVMFHYAYTTPGVLPAGALRPPNDDLVAALKLRRLAEEAAWSALPDGQTRHPYAEQVFHWVARRIEEADRERGLGQDGLFAGEGDWPEARRHLAEAKRLYDLAQQDAAEVRQALSTCHEVLAALPYYSQWLARRRPADDRKAAEIDDLVGKAVQLWQATHLLAYRLEARDPDAAWISKAPPRDDFDLDPKPLKERSQQVRKQFLELKGVFDAHCQGLAGNIETLTQRQDLEDALTVPLIPAALRLDLLRNYRRIGHDFNVESGKERGKAAAVPEYAYAKQNAQWQGRLALAALGKRLVDEQPEKFAVNYEGLLQKVKFPAEREWWASLTEAGDAVGKSWQGLPRQINEQTQESRQQGLERAAALLARADRLARLIDAGGAAQVRQDPADEYRRLQMHSFLLWQARRAVQDHWYGEQDRRYYDLVARLFAQDAAGLVSGDKGALSADAQAQRLAEVRQVWNLLDRTAPVALRAESAYRPWTSQTRLPLRFTWEAPAAGLPGYPVFYVEADPPLRLEKVDPKARQVVRSFAKPDPGKPNTFPYDLELARGPGEARKPAVVVHGFYRGRVLPAETRVEMVPGADYIVQQYYVRPKGGVAVISDEQVPFGAVNILFDRSGSMKEGGKYKDATEALKEVLNDLPEGTYVSLRIFAPGSAPNGGLIRESKPWKKADLDELLKELKKYGPDGDTPAASTIVKSLKDFPKDFRGSKTIVVLTDGVDSEQDPTARLEKFERPEMVASYLVRNFAKNPEAENVKLHLLLFKLSDAESKIAEKQFGVIRDPKEFPTPGKLTDVAGKAALIRELKGSLRPRVHILKEQGGKALAKFDVNYEGQSEQVWSPALDADGDVYELIAHNSAQKLLLHRGDRLLVALRKQGDGVDFRRALFAGVLGLPKERQAKSRDWLVSALQNKLDRVSDGLQLLVGMEDYKNVEPVDQLQGKRLLRQYHPGFVWFEVRGRDSANPNDRQPLKVSNVVGYPAPAWRLDVPRWVPERGQEKVGDHPARPAVQAWWSNTERIALGSEAVRRNPDRRLADDFQVLPLVDGQKVTLKARVEEREVEAEPGQGLVKRPCLVVDVEWQDKGRPFLVQPELKGVEGAQHLIFSEQKRYTGVFWPVTPAKVEEVGSESFLLHLISVAKFKEQAEAAGLTATIELDRPNQNDSFPAPVELEKPR